MDRAAADRFAEIVALYQASETREVLDGFLTGLACLSARPRSVHVEELEGAA